MKRKSKLKPILLFIFTICSVLCFVIALILGIARKNMISLKRKELQTIKKEKQLFSDKISKKKYKIKKALTYNKILEYGKSKGLHLPTNNYKVVRVNKGKYPSRKTEKNFFVKLFNKLKFKENVKAKDDIN